MNKLLLCLCLLPAFAMAQSIPAASPPPQATSSNPADAAFRAI